MRSVVTRPYISVHVKARQVRFLLLLPRYHLGSTPIPLSSPIRPWFDVYRVCGEDSTQAHYSYVSVSTLLWQYASLFASLSVLQAHMLPSPHLHEMFATDGPAMAAAADSWWKNWRNTNIQFFKSGQNRALAMAYRPWGVLKRLSVCCIMPKIKLSFREPSAPSLLSKGFCCRIKARRYLSALYTPTHIYMSILLDAVTRTVSERRKHNPIYYLRLVENVNTHQVVHEF